MANFWNSMNVDPKRSFRFVMTFGGSTTGGTSDSEIHQYFVKMAKKPSFTVSNVQHQFVAHTFNFPGRLAWDPVEVTFVDPINPDASNALINVLAKSGYQLPTDGQRPGPSFNSISRLGATQALGQPRITQIDGNGQDVDEWTLWNAWIERVDFGQLDYGSEEMVNVVTSIRYDYASYKHGSNGLMVNSAWDPGAA
jgi:hypothetical protein